MVTRGALWMAWMVAGAYALAIPQLLGKKHALLGAFAAASPQGKACVGLWILGSIILCSMFLRAIQIRNAQLRARAP